jgi:hypothetical protein
MAWVHMVTCEKSIPKSLEKIGELLERINKVKLYKIWEFRSNFKGEDKIIARIA